MKTQEFVMDETADCWTDDFNAYLYENEGLSMPIAPDTFNEKLMAWSELDPTGQLAKS